MSELADQIKQILSGLFNVGADTLSTSSSSENVEGWDSMGQLMVIVELEQQFGLQISPEEGEGLTSVVRIEQFLKARM